MFPDAASDGPTALPAAAGARILRLHSGSLIPVCVFQLKHLSPIAYWAAIDNNLYLALVRIIFGVGRIWKLLVDWRVASMESMRMPPEDERSLTSDYLALAVRDAIQLTSLVARRGIPIEVSDLETLGSTRRDLEAGTLTMERERDFWLAFQRLSNAARPTTIESLRWSMSARPFIGSIVLWLLGAILLASAFIANVYTIKLESVGARVAELRVERAAQQQAHAASYAAFETARIQAEFEGAAAVMEASAPNDGSGGGPTAAERIALIAAEKLSEADFNKLNEIDNQIRSNFHVLEDLRWIYPRGIERFEKESDRLNYMFAHAGAMKQILAAFILPAIYGLLGALTFILRSHAAAAEAATLSGTVPTAYAVRLTLGAVAGIAIGLFVQPDSVQEAESEIFAALLPISLAFLAGYGVDLLFNGMDRLILAFSGPPQPPPAASGRT